MDTEGYWIGLDTGVEQTSVCVIDEHGEIIDQKDCPTDAGALAEVLADYPRDRIRLLSIEAGVGTHMVRDLRALGYPLRVCEVRRASKFLAIHRQKTDENDANGMAEFGRVGRSIGSEVYLKPLECQNIRTQLAARAKALEMRMSVDGLIQSVVRLHGGQLKLRFRAGTLTEDVEPQLAVLARDGVNVDADIRPLVEMAEHLRAHLARTDRRLASMAKSHPVCSRLLSVPGVGPLTALSFYSAIGNPDRFRRVRDVGPYLGLTPSLRQSGRFHQQGRISKMGNKMTRTHLVSAATVLLSKCRTECALRTWGLELSKRKGRTKARVALARKLAVVMMRVWLDGTQFEADGLPNVVPART